MARAPALQFFEKPEECVLLGWIREADRAVDGGDGYQTVAMAHDGAAFVLGVDIERQRLEHGRRMARGLLNVVFSEKTVFAVRRLYRNGASRGYLPGINKMTIRRFEKIVNASGLNVVSLEYKAVKNLPVLSHLPAIREFFINRVNCILTM